MAFSGRAELAQSRAGGTSRGDVSKVGTWADRGAQFIRPVRQTNGLISVEATRLAREVALLMAEAAPAVSEELSRALVPAAKAAFDAWPVGRRDKPIHSKELVGLEYKVLAPGIWAASLVNRASYALFIRKGRTARRLIFERGTRAADLAARRLGDTLSKG
jgi:hypothetical protein